MQPRPCLQVNVFYGPSTAKMFADRCGRIATADLPLLFLFVGRNNILTSLTGLSYQVRPSLSLSS